MRCTNLDHVRNRHLPVVTRQPDAAGIYDHPPVPQTNHSRNVSVPAQHDLGVDPFSSSLNSIDVTRTYAAVVGYVVEPKSRVIPWRCVAQEHFISMHKRGWHARHPNEVLALKLPKIAPRRDACLPEFNKNSILIAPHRRKSTLNQQVRSSSRLKWAAYVIAKVHDVANSEGSYVRKYGLKCRTIPVYVRDCSKLHLAPPIRAQQNRPPKVAMGHSRRWYHVCSHVRYPRYRPHAPTVRCSIDRGHIAAPPRTGAWGHFQTSGGGTRSGNLRLGTAWGRITSWTN